MESWGAHTLGFAVQDEDRLLLDELAAYFGNGNRSAYLRASLHVMRSVMLAEQMREHQAYGQQRTAELGVEPTDVPALVQSFLEGPRADPAGNRAVSRPGRPPTAVVYDVNVLAMSPWRGTPILAPAGFAGKVDAMRRNSRRISREHHQRIRPRPTEDRDEGDSGGGD